VDFGVYLVDSCDDNRIQNEMQCRFLEKISPEQLDTDLVRKLPLEFLKKQCAIPLLLENDNIAIALAEPLNIEAYDAISSVLTSMGKVIDTECSRVTCPAAEIEHAISSCYYHNNNTDSDEKNAQVQDFSSADDSSSVQTKAEDLLNIASKAPIVKLVNKIFFQAVHSRASDIHIEPYESEARIRFRVDGVLHDVFTIPKKQVSALVSRLKIMANLNIAERRLPQDGQSRIKIGEDFMDVRVSVIPTLGGERVTLRLLDKSCGKLGLDQTGFSNDVLTRFKSLIGLAHGIILLTGPTGSGKTTTLYAAMNELNCEERNILTVEDPIEYQLCGVGQMQIKPKIGLTFANCLRHILRQDPDIIMIGEIRDVETAEIAIQASLTGHLVLSTLHTNDAASAVTRLIDMGIEPYLISSSVAAVMAQRLLRVICPECKTPYTPGEEPASLGSQDRHVQFYKGQGCENCIQTGYLGRTGIFELLIVDDDIRESILRRSGAHIIKEAAIEKGMTTLRQDGLRKAISGQTTLEEVSRVTQDMVQTNMEVLEHAGR